MYVSSPDTPDIAVSLQNIEYNTNLICLLLVIAFAFAFCYLLCKCLYTYFNAALS